MPIFKYNCENCKEVTMVMHTAGEDIADCNKCNTENSLVRLLNKPFISKKAHDTSKDAPGKLTKKYIEENREILEQQKKEIKNRTYDKT